MKDPTAHESLYDIFQENHMREWCIEAVAVAGLKQCIPTLRQIVKGIGDGIRKKKINHSSTILLNAREAAIFALAHFRDKDSVPLLISEYETTYPNNFGIIEALYVIEDRENLESYFKLIKKDPNDIETHILCALIMKVGEEIAKDKLSKILMNAYDPKCHIAYEGTWYEDIFFELVSRSLGDKWEWVM